MVLRVRKRPGKEREDVLLAAGEKASTQAMQEEEEEEDPYSAYLQVCVGGGGEPVLPGPPCCMPCLPLLGALHTTPRGHLGFVSHRWACIEHHLSKPEFCHKCFAHCFAG